MENKKKVNNKLKRVFDQIDSVNNSLEPETPGEIKSEIRQCIKMMEELELELTNLEEKRTKKTRQKEPKPNTRKRLADDTPTNKTHTELELLLEKKTQ